MIALLLALAISQTTPSIDAQASADSPCFTFMVDEPVDLEPKTPLEKIYFGASVCYRQKWLDALSAVKSATTSLSQRDRDLAAERLAPAAAPVEVASSVAPALITGIVAAALGLAAGILIAQ